MWGKMGIEKNPSTKTVKTVRDLIHYEDAPILAGALRAKADFLVSLDRGDFFTATLRNVDLPLHIVTPQMFFQEYWNIFFEHGA